MSLISALGKKAFRQFQNCVHDSLNGFLDFRCTGDTKQSRRLGPGEIVSTGSPPYPHASNPAFDPNRLADQQSSAAPSSHHQTTCTVQIQPRQPECSGPVNEGRGQPKWDPLQGGPNVQSDGPGHRGYLPPAENNAAPAVLGKRKLPSSFSGQQPGQPAALSTLRPLCLPKVTLPHHHSLKKLLQ